jgi:DNA-binding winged helix-turn-helix (wHTH) protein
MKTVYGRIALIGGSPVERASFEAWCREHALVLLSFPLEPPPEVANLRQLDALVIGADEHPLLALAECGRLRVCLPDLPVALLGRQPAGELGAAAERAGAFVLANGIPQASPWEALPGLLAERHSAAARENRVWISERLCLDRTRRVLYLDGEERTLSAAKFDLLSYLFDNAGRAVSARELVRRGLLIPSQASRYKGLIAELRHHLGSERDCIRAVPGYGYRLELREPASPSRAQNAPLSATFEPASPSVRLPLFP